jgi:hypothetical protein
VRSSGTLGPGTKLGSGWRGYDAIVGPGDLTGDDVPDLLARSRATGALWLFPRTAPLYGRAGWGRPIRVSTGWRGFSLLTGPGDLTRDGRPDLLARAADGTLRLFPGTGSVWRPFGTPVVVARGFNAYDAVVGPGDDDRDGLPDLLARDRATGGLWRFSRTESGGWRRPVRVGTGWSSFDAIS